MYKVFRYSVTSIAKNILVISGSRLNEAANLKTNLLISNQMAQKSITSFFSKAATTKPSVIKEDKPTKTTPKKEVYEAIINEDSCSPVKNVNRNSKRLRIDSDSDSNSPPSKKDNNSDPHEKVESKPKPNGKAAKEVSEEAVKVETKSPANKRKQTTPKSKKSPKEKKATKKSPVVTSQKVDEDVKKESEKTDSEEEIVTKSKKSNGKKANGKKRAISNSEDEDVDLKENVKTEKRSSKEKNVKQEKVESEPSPPKKAAGFHSFFTVQKKLPENSETKVVENNKKKDDKTGNNYNPAHSPYHPIDDASWTKGEKVPYLALARTMEEIEKISARLKIVEILSNYFRSVMVLTPADLLPSVYLCLNKLAPAYESVELGIAETTLMKAIAQSTGRSVAHIKNELNTTGDLGTVAEQSRSNQRMMFQPAALSVRLVFDRLKEIAMMTGHASMSKKVDKIQSMFVACRHAEARYLIRSLQGKLRIGLAEQSVLQAIAQACATTPPLATQEEAWPPKILNASKGLTPEQFKAVIDEQALILKTTYCACPTYDQLVPVLLKHGVAALPDHCSLTPGIPLKPMLAHPTKGVHEVLQRFENVEFTCEWKYDGERAQIHVPSIETDARLRANVAKASIYSRNQENNTTKYPDVLGRLSSALKETVQSCVLDCEAVAWDKDKKQILPFQILSTRKRKDANEADIKVAVCLFMFDLLYLNGESLVTKPFEERRRLLRENFNTIEGEWHMASSLDCSTTESIQEFLEESVRGNCEGLMVKTLNGKDATYEIAKRSRNWLKLKKDYLEGVGDTIDAVVLGGYLGRGKRAGVYGGFLLACHDRQNDEYQTLCKIGTGFSEEDLKTHSAMLKEHILEAPKNYYRYDSSLEPDHWFAPSQVWEIKCADLSLSPVHRAALGIIDSDKGISLRFPRFIRVRDDKTAEQATSAQQIADLYCNQDQVKNQAAEGSKNFEEDFY